MKVFAIIPSFFCILIVKKIYLPLQLIASTARILSIVAFFFFSTTSKVPVDLFAVNAAAESQGLLFWRVHTRGGALKDERTEFFNDQPNVKTFLRRPVSILNSYLAFWMGYGQM